MNHVHPMVIMGTALFFIWSFTVPAFVKAKDSGTVVVKVESKSESLRQLSEKYLQDPNRWQDILRANGFTNIHEIRPGMTLEIPVDQILALDREIQLASQMIQKAIQAGAKIFAPKQLDTATNLKAAALAQRKEGNWSLGRQLANQSLQQAKEALTISDSKKDVPAEAVLKSKKGEVNKRTPPDQIWHEIQQYNLLGEGDHVRTLANSYAEILFRDESRIRLKSNAQAIIRKIRSDLLNDTHEASISLVKGDVLALLAGGRQVNLNIPGVKTRIDSNNVWISQDRDNNVARVANYDGEVEISSGGGKVLLKKNQGSVVVANQKPSTPKDLLPSPKLLYPENDSRFFTRDISFSWSSVDGAIFYLIEFSTDSSFSEIIGSKEIMGFETSLPPTIDQGTIYWRVTAFSKDQLPGRYSIPGFFHLLRDETPPYLVIHSPANGTILHVPQVTVSGVTEPEADLKIGDQSVAVNPDGSFQFSISLKIGENTIPIQAIDDAKNMTKRIRSVVFAPDSEIPFSWRNPMAQLDPDTFVTNSSFFPVSGKTLPESRITITSDSGKSVSSLTDDKGHFTVNLHLSRPTESFQMRIETKDGRSKKIQFSAVLDNTPPEISLNSELPSFTQSESLKISGTALEASQIRINQIPVPIDQGNFHTTIPLAPGPNVIEIQGEDLAQNKIILEKTVFLDNQSPTLLAHHISPHHAKGGDSIFVKIQAKDDSPLAKVAKVAIIIGAHMYRGILSKPDANGIYSGTFRIPKHFSGNIKLSSIWLSDCLGNAKEYTF